MCIAEESAVDEILWLFACYEKIRPDKSVVSRVFAARCEQLFYVGLSCFFSGEPEATCSVDKKGEPVCDRCQEGHEGKLCDRYLFRL